MDRTKILHVLQSDRYSGAENVVSQIINMFNTNKNIEMVYCSQDGPIRDVLKKLGIKFIPLKKLSFKELKHVVDEFKPDIIHAHDATASVLSSLVARNSKVISHLHNNPPWIKKLGVYSLLYFMSAIKYDKILTVSPSVMDEYILGKRLMRKTELLGNPNDPIIIRNKAQTGEDKKSFDVIFIGRLTEQKDPLRFIRIIHQLKREIGSISVAIIGEGELRNDCLTLIEELNLIENIELKGFLENPYPLMVQSKVHCMTSKWEGYGLVATEALALGLPVVCTAVGGLTTIVTDNCGKLCSNDMDMISELKALLTNKDYLKKKSKNALERANSLSNINEYKKKLLKIYQL